MIRGHRSMKWRNSCEADKKEVCEKPFSPKWFSLRFTKYSRMQQSIDFAVPFHHKARRDSPLYLVVSFAANVCLFTAIAIQSFPFGLLWNSKWSTYLGHEKKYDSPWHAKMEKKERSNQYVVSNDWVHNQMNNVTMCIYK